MITVPGFATIYETNMEARESIDESFIAYVESLLIVMYIANASDCDGSKCWQRNHDAGNHYTPVSRVLSAVIGVTCYEYYISTDEFDWKLVDSSRRDK